MIAEDELLPPSYSTPEACRAAGATYRKADYWCRIGLVVPTLAIARGSGTSRRYSEVDVDCLRAVVRLRKMGMGLKACERVVAAVRGGDWTPIPLGGGLLVDPVELARGDAVAA